MPTTFATMEQETQTATLTELASGIMDDVQSLLKQQLQMLKAEFAQDLRRTRQMAQCVAVGAFLIAFSGIFLLIASVHLLQYLTQWPEWAAWATIGGVALVCGLVALVIGWRIMKSYNPLPDKTFHALQENVSCLTTRPN